LAVRIRLTRVGATKRPAYRVIAIDRRRSRDGRALEILGYYDPLTEPATVNLDTAKIQAWIGKGAQPSDTVAKLMRLAARPADETAGKPKRATRAAKPSRKAAAKAEAAAAAPLAPEAEAAGDSTAPTEPETAPATEAPAEPEAAASDVAADEAPDAAEAVVDEATTDADSDEPNA
jgi:small subunit ribosomal protein S16